MGFQLMFAMQPITPTIVKVVPPPAQEVGVLDVLVGAVGLTGVIVIGSLVFGGALGALIIWYKSWRDARLGDQERSTSATRLNLSSR